MASDGRTDLERDGEMKALHLTTVGMHCTQCTTLVERAVKGIEGIISVSSSDVENRTSVLYDEHVADVDSILGAIASVGFDATVED